MAGSLDWACLSFECWCALFALCLFEYMMALLRLCLGCLCCDRSRSLSSSVMKASQLYLAFL